MGLKRVMWVRRYQRQCRALRPLGHQGYRLRSYNKDQPLCSGYTKVEVDKDELSKLMSQGTELAKEIQEIKRNWVPRSDNKNKENNQNDQNKDKDKKPRNRRKKGFNEVDAEENTPTSTTDAP